MATEAKVYRASRVNMDKVVTMFLKAPELYFLTKKYPVILAGGACQTLVDPKVVIFDYDFFFPDLSFLDDLRNMLVKLGFLLTFECPRGELYSYEKNGNKIQLITHRTYSSPEQVILSFDITAGMIAYQYDSVYFTKEAIRSVCAKEVTLNKVTYPVSTFKRILKYVMNKGYRIPTTEVLDFVVAVNKMLLDAENQRFYID